MISLAATRWWPEAAGGGSEMSGGIGIGLILGNQTRDNPHSLSAAPMSLTTLRPVLRAWAGTATHCITHVHLLTVFFSRGAVLSFIR